MKQGLRIQRMGHPHGPRRRILASRLLVLGALIALGPAAMAAQSTGWFTQSAPSSVAALSAVACVGTSYCWAGGADTSGREVIIGSTDGGNTWVSQAVLPAQSGASLNDVSCISTSECWAVDTVGEVFTTSDGGSTWSLEATLPDAADASRLVCVDGLNCWAVGWVFNVATGAIYASLDGGTSWTAQVENGDGAISDVACTDASTCFAVGGSGSGAATIYATTNGGGTWGLQQAPENQLKLYGVSCVDDSHCWAVGDTGVIATADGGAHWMTQLSRPLPALFRGVSCVNASHCWVAARGVVQATTNGGARWFREQVPTRVQLEEISCTSSTLCWAVGADRHAPVIIATATGSTWKQRR